jgi:hypothetical protein
MKKRSTPKGRYSRGPTFISTRSERTTGPLYQHIAMNRLARKQCVKAKPIENILYGPELTPKQGPWKEHEGKHPRRLSPSKQRREAYFAKAHGAA